MVSFMAVFPEGRARFRGAKVGRVFYPKTPFGNKRKIALGFRLRARARDGILGAHTNPRKYPCHVPSIRRAAAFPASP